MNTYDFTIKFRLPDPSADPDQYMEALAEAGCDDAMVGIGVRGRIALDFSREARSALAAVSSAVRDVQRAIPGAELVEASPDFVGLSDVAELAGFSRQNMRKLTMTHAATFPAAVHEGTPSLWHLASILAWLREDQKRQVDAELLEVAQANMAFNIAREVRRLPGASLPKELESLFA
jgi:hypothetical protein